MLQTIARRLSNEFGGQGIDSTLSNFLLHKLDEHALTVLPVELQFIVDDCGVYLREVDDLNAPGLVSKGEILINASDIQTRQRFTVAHEIMHFLLRRYAEDSDPEEEEALCDRGASHILIPQKHFVEKYNDRNVSIQLARRIASDCHVSLLAALTSLTIRGASAALTSIWEVTESESLRLCWTTRSESLGQDIWLPKGLELSPSKKVSRWAAGDKHFHSPNEIVIQLRQGKFRFASEFIPYGENKAARVLSVLRPLGRF